MLVFPSSTGTSPLWPKHIFQLAPTSMCSHVSQVLLVLGLVENRPVRLLLLGALVTILIAAREVGNKMALLELSVGTRRSSRIRVEEALRNHCEFS